MLIAAIAQGKDDPKVCGAKVDPAANKPQPAEVKADETCDDVLDGKVTIPVGTFYPTPLPLPILPLRVTQIYNTFGTPGMNGH